MGLQQFDVEMIVLVAFPNVFVDRIGQSDAEAAKEAAVFAEDDMISRFPSPQFRTRLIKVTKVRPV